MVTLVLGVFKTNKYDDIDKIIFFSNQNHVKLYFVICYKHSNGSILIILFIIKIINIIIIVIISDLISCNYQIPYINYF